jgi:SAM-dependent methyltransferase
MLAEANLGNVTVVEAKSRDSGLPAGCCDAIVLRRVYHHLTDPAETNASLLRALCPGGVLKVIDIPPPFFIGRGSLGVPAQSVVDEVTASGFEMLQLHRDWPGRGPLESYCAVFRRLLTGVSFISLSQGRGTTRSCSRGRAFTATPVEGRHRKGVLRTRSVGGGRC